MTDETTITLYDTPGSPCARRVRMTLIEKRLPFERVILDLARMDNKAAWYLKINPNGQVPAIRIGDSTLYESNVITEYLDAIYPEPKLYPENATDYAQVKQWQTFEAVISKHYGLLQYARLLGPLSRIQYSLDGFMALARQRTMDPALLQWETRVWRGEVLTADQELSYERALYERLGELEAALHGRSFLVGERFSQAEISVYPRIAMYPYLRLKIDPARYPNVSAWMQRLRDRPSFTRSATIADRIMSQPRAADLIDWADPKHVSGGGLTRRLALRAVRGLLAQNIMRLQKDMDRVRRIAAYVVPRQRLAAPATLQKARSSPPAPVPGAWQVHGCPFNSETRIAVATLMACDADFTFHPVLTPLAEEFSAVHRTRAGPPEVPYIVCADGPVRGWPYVLARIGEHAGASPLYPGEPWLRAQVQIGCMGDSVVNFKYKRPLQWQCIVGPKLRTRLPDIAALRAQLAAHEVDSSASDFIVSAWSGKLLDATTAEAYLGLLAQRARFVGSACLSNGWFAGPSFTLADIAEWVRTEESIDLGLGLGDGDRELRAASAWRERIAAMPFADRWRRWLGDAIAAFVSPGPHDPSTTFSSEARHP